MVTFEYTPGLEALDPAARAAGRVCLREEVIPVRDTADQPAEVDVVEGGGGEGPWPGAVLDFTIGGRRLAVWAGGR